MSEIDIKPDYFTVHDSPEDDYCYDIKGIFDPANGTAIYVTDDIQECICGDTISHVRFDGDDFYIRCSYCGHTSPKYSFEDYKHMNEENRNHEELGNYSDFNSRAHRRAVESCIWWWNSLMQKNINIRLREQDQARRKKLERMERGENMEED